MEKRSRKYMDDFEDIWLKLEMDCSDQLFQDWMDADDCVWALIMRFQNKNT